MPSKTMFNIKRNWFHWGIVAVSFIINLCIFPQKNIVYFLILVHKGANES